MIRRFFREQDGQDGVEYALLIGFVSALIIAGASAFTTAFDAFWGGAAATMGTATSNLP